ncbi:uncharacterized protein LACBIDRAFT_335194 [Laccaria bicolor S238N-H82]|uniref:Predicted protein n=1 Tax=Laccaria bicolor (strain S238N-H82 / ATCC MYA-4686) TaxID=486041 RepID=B0E1N1_LACBS|nr:uncharacterized protein LACBIDRAFT_335194 [Laccaria bicolor S238N-H82]EDQ99269.1 predicted protein [Laccaria bicolor S238N-H82]|eukprot:XP_001890079.1 predicted protein [Laccaria bicolor S238N-H82]
MHNVVEVDLKLNKLTAKLRQGNFRQPLRGAGRRPSDEQLRSSHNQSHSPNYLHSRAKSCSKCILKTTYPNQALLLIQIPPHRNAKFFLFDVAAVKWNVFGMGSVILLLEKDKTASVIMKSRTKMYANFSMAVKHGIHRNQSIGL